MVPMTDLNGMKDWAESVMSRPPDFVIGKDYLRRWWIIPRNEFSNVYLHDIRKSDDDRAFHDHPWPNTSFLILGNYIEHTPEGSFVRKAGDVIHREAGALHRLEVIPGERAISLFITGRKEREWGFDCNHVEKTGGDYHFVGTVQAIFLKRKSGAVRLVVENDAGILMVMNGKQLERIEPTPTALKARADQ